MTTCATDVRRATTGGFAPAEGLSEHLIALESSPGPPLAESLAELDLRYRVALEARGLSAGTALFTRFYVSDAANQTGALTASRLYASVAAGAAAVIEQRPLSGARLAMLSYHVSGATATRTNVAVDQAGTASARSACLLSAGNYRMLWCAGFSADCEFDSEAQTARILDSLQGALGRQGMSMERNLLRTWIYVRDIDNHYGGMVVARRCRYERLGMTRRKLYPASTGIGGAGRDPSCLVAIDSLAIDGLQPGQVTRMEALGNMPPTITYGVTFERGLRIRFGDRSHLYVSGTASIGPDGTVMHPGDPVRQAGRALDNVGALLAAQGAGLGDMSYMLLYVRDPSDAAAVLALVSERVPANVPLIAVQAPVCRPGWLVEMEGCAVVPDDAPFAPLR